MIRLSSPGGYTAHTRFKPKRVLVVFSEDSSGMGALWPVR